MSSIRHTETQLGELLVKDEQTFSSSVCHPFLHLFDAPGAVILVQEGRPIATSTFVPFPGLAHLSMNVRAARMRPAERAGCSVSISATNFQRPCTREATESRSCRLSPSWITQADTPRGLFCDDHEDRLAANPDSSEVRLTPRLQLRRNLVDRSRGASPRARDPVRTSPWPAFSAQRKAHKAASAAPCRALVDQPVKVRPAHHAKTGLQRPHVNGTMRQPIRSDFHRRIP